MKLNVELNEEPSRGSRSFHCVACHHIAVAGYRLLGERLGLGDPMRFGFKGDACGLSYTMWFLRTGRKPLEPLAGTGLGASAFVTLGFSLAIAALVASVAAAAAASFSAFDAFDAFAAFAATFLVFVSFMSV